MKFLVIQVKVINIEWLLLEKFNRSFMDKSFDRESMTKKKAWHWIIEYGLRLGCRFLEFVMIHEPLNVKYHKTRTKLHRLKIYQF